MSEAVDRATDQFVARFLERMHDEIIELIRAVGSEYGNPILSDGSVLPELRDAMLRSMAVMLANTLYASLLPAQDPSQPVN